MHNTVATLRTSTRGSSHKSPQHLAQLSVLANYSIGHSIVQLLIIFHHHGVALAITSSLAYPNTAYKHHISTHCPEFHNDIPKWKARRTKICCNLKPGTNKYISLHSDYLDLAPAFFSAAISCTLCFASSAPWTQWPIARNKLIS